MPLHTFIAYLKYTWKAKGRHGTHSPFVYDLVEHVLLDKSIINKGYIIEYPSLPLKYENLVSRIAAYYNYREILLLPSGTTGNADTGLLLISEANPNEWESLVERHVHLLNQYSAIVIQGIHKTRQHTAAWNRLRAMQAVRMSIDIYAIGLLLFREEFKEKQHFILKY